MGLPPNERLPFRQPFTRELENTTHSRGYAFLVVVCDNQEMAFGKTTASEWIRSQIQSLVQGSIVECQQNDDSKDFLVRLGPKEFRLTAEEVADRDWLQKVRLAIPENQDIG